MSSLAFEIKQENGGRIPTIGFTNQYYTLWYVSIPKMNKYTQEVNYNYVQNLSMNYEDALKKMQEKFSDDFAVDLSLRSDSSFTTTKDMREELIPTDCFSFGKLEGQKFSDCDDIWQLDRAKDAGQCKEERRINARNRLVELGELVEFEGEFLTKFRVENILKDRFFKKGSGHHFNDGEKVELELKEFERFNFDGYFGLTWVVTYISKDNKFFKYMGGSPCPKIEDFTKVKFTIKHSEYNGSQETKILRMKVLLCV